MESKKIDIDLIDIWKAFKRCWIALVVIVVLGFIGGYYLAKKNYIPSFASDAQIMILSEYQETIDIPGVEINPEMKNNIFMLGTYIEFVGSDIVVDHLKETFDFAKNNINISVQRSDSSPTIRVIATSNDAQISANVANAVAPYLYEEISKYFIINDFVILKDAKVNSTSTSVIDKGIILNGFVVGCGISFIVLLITIYKQKIKIN